MAIGFHNDLFDPIFQAGAAREGGVAHHRKGNREGVATMLVNDWDSVNE